VQPAEQSVVNRQPFDKSSSLPTDIVMPLETLASAPGFHVLGEHPVLGREAYEVELPYRQAIPLIGAIEAGGIWRSFEPTDPVRLWIDTQTLFPLRVEVDAGSGVARRVWAASRGYDDRPGKALLTVDTTSFSAAPARHAVFVPPTSATARDGGFTGAPFDRVAAEAPTFVDGLRAYRAGTTEEGQQVLTYASGITYLKVTSEPERSSLPFYENTAEEIHLPDGEGWAYYQPASETSGRRLDIYGAAHHVQLDSNLARSTLLEVARSLNTVGRRAPRRIGTLKGLTVERVAPARAYGKAGFAREPSYLPTGYAATAALLSRAENGEKTLSVYYRSPEAEYGGFGIRVAQSAPTELLPPGSVDFIDVRVGGEIARWSPDRGELEWIDHGVYRAVAAPSFDLSTVVRIAQSLR
jgi:hypothetical protein